MVVALTLPLLSSSFPTDSRFKSWCELSAVIPLYFEETDFREYVREFSKQPRVFTSLILNLIMHAVKWVDVKLGLWHLVLFFFLPWLESPNSSQAQEQEVHCAYHSRRHPADSGAGVTLLKGSRVSWDVPVFGLAPDLGDKKELLVLEVTDRNTSNLCGAKCINSLIFSLLSF